MQYSEQEIYEFSKQVRQLLLKYKEMRQELHDMKERVSAQERDVKSMETLANASMHDYDMLKTAKMLEVSNGDLEATRQRINKLVRDVDRCITLLSEQQNNSQK
ncbi:MAG: hypothetical protein II314_06265 [Prevotella sp.]|jgi:hypothetical protein|nr:hypothetical protein [Prevotella sp.]MEE1120325.1 hypothetical protein [Prevotella sp.]